MKYMMLLLFSTNLYAWDLGLSKREPVSIKEMYIEYRDIETWRNPYYDGKTDWKFTSDFQSTVEIYELLYHTNKFHFSMDDTQIRHAGWEYYAGLKVTNWLKVFKYHHSEHMLEQVPTDGKRKFPVEDSYGFRVDFITGDSK